MTSKLYSVKKTMDLTHLSRKQLFYYEQKGLLGKVFRNDINNYRFYTEEQIIQLIFIKECRQIGFVIDDIQELINNKQPAVLRQIVKQSTRSAKLELDRAIKQYEHNMESYNSLLEASFILENQRQVCGEINLIEVPERYVICYQHEDTFFFDIATIAKIGSQIDNIVEKYQLIKLAPPLIMFENHFDADKAVFTAQKAKINFMYELSENHPSCPHCKHLPSHRAISAISVGNYDQDIALTYQKLWQWAKDHNYKLQNTSIEEALLGPSFSYTETNYWISRVSILLDE